MKAAEIRRKLIDGTVRVIAREGLDKTSAKQIEQETGINVVYIYRYFENKDDLLVHVFEDLDHELIAAFEKHVQAMELQGVSRKVRSRMLFAGIWRFLLSNPDKCLAYMRYYYSTYLKEFSYERHQQDYAPVVEKMSPLFREEADVWMILTHVLNVMLNFSIQVFNGAAPDNEDTEEHVFRLIWCSVEQYFKRSEEEV